MTAVKICIGGVLVDSTAVAQARIGGVWVDFGPGDPDPGDQSLFTGETPFGIAEDGLALSQGVRFRSSRNGNISMGRWYFGSSPPTTAKCAIYRVSDMAQLKTATFGAPTANAWNNAAFTPVVPITAGVDYMAVGWTQNRYPYTPSYPWPHVSGDLTADGAYFVAAADLAFPTSPTTLNLFCDFVFNRA
jgi:hypothetical protein